MEPQLHWLLSHFSLRHYAKSQLSQLKVKASPSEYSSDIFKKEKKIRKLYKTGTSLKNETALLRLSSVHEGDILFLARMNVGKI